MNRLVVGIVDITRSVPRSLPNAAETRSSTGRAAVATAALPGLNIVRSIRRTTGAAGVPSRVTACASMSGCSAARRRSRVEGSGGAGGGGTGCAAVARVTCGMCIGGAASACACTMRCRVEIGGCPQQKAAAQGYRGCRWRPIPAHPGCRVGMAPRRLASVARAREQVPQAEQRSPRVRPLVYPQARRLRARADSGPCSQARGRGTSPRWPAGSVRVLPASA